MSPVQKEPADLWTMAGAFVWHETAVDPEALGVQLRDNASAGLRS
jgi:hypothetical protein